MTSPPNTRLTPYLHSQHYPWVDVSALPRYPPIGIHGHLGLGSLPELNGHPPGRQAATHLPTHSSLLCHLPSLMAAQAADVSRLECSAEGKGGTHFTGTQDDPLPLLGVPHPHPSSLERGWGRRQTRGGKHIRSLSAAAHKALHLLLAFQAPPRASFFRGSRMPPSVVGGTVPPAFAALPPTSRLSRLLPAPRHRLRRQLSPGSGAARAPYARGAPAPRGSGQRSSVRPTTSPSSSATRSPAHSPNPPRSGRIPTNPSPRRS